MSRDRLWRFSIWTRSQPQECLACPTFQIGQSGANSPRRSVAVGGMPELFQGDVCTRFQCHFTSGVNARDAIQGHFRRCSGPNAAPVPKVFSTWRKMGYGVGFWIYVTIKSGCLVLNNQARGPGPLALWFLLLDETFSSV